MKALLYMQTAEIMEQYIKTSDLPKGTKLPSERVLAKKYHVSRNVIRQAFTQLSKNGIVELRPNDGAYIQYSCDEKIISALKKMLVQNRSSFLDALEVREVIETAIVGKCISFLNEQNLAKLEQTFQLMEKYRQEKKIESFLSCDESFHSQIAQIIPNPMFQMLLKTFFNTVPHSFFTLSKTLQTAMDDTQNEHYKIIDALFHRNAQAAIEAVSIHMANIRKDLKLLEESDFRSL